MIYLSVYLLLWAFSPVHTIASPVEWLTPTEHDFGDLKHDVPVTVDFRFKNNGDAPLSIDNVRTSCGCTVTDWSEEIVLPGEESAIHVEFDARNPGYFRKKITVFFSTWRKGEKLYVEGYVE